VDFWPQHKDFVLRVLAGAGVFLVALIARAVYFGDELERARAENEANARKLAAMQLLPLDQIQALSRNGERLAADVRELAAQIGWDASEPDLEAKLVERALSYLRRNRDAGAAALREEAAAALRAIQDDFSGGFGQLRGTLRDELLDEASEFNVRVAPGLGFDQVTSVRDVAQLRQFLLQLELVARVVRYAIDARVAAVEDVRIDAEKPRPPASGVNPALLVEHTVTFQLVLREKALNTIVNRLRGPVDGAGPSPGVPLRRLFVQRKAPQGDALVAEIAAVAVAVDPTQSFRAKTETKP
jgi:hypothetical protein